MINKKFSDEIINVKRRIVNKMTVDVLQCVSTNVALSTRIHHVKATVKDSFGFYDFYGIRTPVYDYKKISKVNKQSVLKSLK